MLRDGLLSCELKCQIVCLNMFKNLKKKYFYLMRRSSNHFYKICVIIVNNEKRFTQHSETEKYTGELLIAKMKINQNFNNY